MELISKRQLELYKFATKDKARVALQSIKFYGDRAIASDGHKLVNYTNTNRLQAGDFPVQFKDKFEGPVMIKAFDAKQQLKFIPKRKDCSGIPILMNYLGIGTEGSKINFHRVGWGNGKIDPNCYQVESNQGAFPDWEQVLLEAERPDRITVRLDPLYLKEICEFIAKGQGNDGSIDIEVCRDSPDKHPVIIRASEERGEITALIMPIRPPKNRAND